MYSFFFLSPVCDTGCFVCGMRADGRTHWRRVGEGWGVSFELADFNFVSGDSSILFLHPSVGRASCGLISV